MPAASPAISPATATSITPATWTIFQRRGCASWNGPLTPADRTGERLSSPAGESRRALLTPGGECLAGIGGARQPERVTLLHGVALLYRQRLTLVERRLAQPQRQRAAPGDVPRPGHRRAAQLSRVVDRIQEAEPKCLLTRQRLTGEKHPPDHALRQVPHHVPAPAAASDRHLGEHEAGPLAAHAHIRAP